MILYAPMRLLSLLLIVIIGVRHVEGAAKTSIYIDQIPLYTQLASCAQDRISAIIRAQASGCGDDSQLTSFACFCVDSSSEFSSIISTAVVDKCQSGVKEATITRGGSSISQTANNQLRARATVTAAPTEEVQQALELFNSYCSKSTELTRFNQPSIAIITQAPETIYVTASSTPMSAQKQSTPIAAVIVLAALIPVISGVALFFVLRYRRDLRGRSRPPNIEQSADQDMHEKDCPQRPNELVCDEYTRFEMPPSLAKPFLEPQNNRAVELDGASEMGSNSQGKLAKLHN